MSSTTRSSRMGRRPPRTAYIESIVEKLVAGAGLEEAASAADMAEAIRRLAGRGYADGQTALVLGTSRRTVSRYRAAYGISPGVPPGKPIRPPVDAPTLPWRRS